MSISDAVFSRWPSFFLDWIWFVGLQRLSYLLILFASVGFLADVSFAMYGVAAGLVLLIITGIRNAWDLILWTCQQQNRKTNGSRNGEDKRPPIFAAVAQLQGGAMKKSPRVLVMAIALAAGATVANAQPVPDPRVTDLVRAGKLRGALFLPQYTTDHATGELRGTAGGVVMIALARALAARLGVEVLLVGHPTPGDVVECLKADACDVALGMGIDPTRTTEIEFSSPFMQLDFTYLVPPGSSILSVADADRPGVRIASVRNHASTLALSRILKHAELVYADTPDTTFDLLRSGHPDALAQARPVLLDYASQLPGSRVLQERYGAYFLAMALPKGHAGRLAYITEFVEDAKASGLVQRAIERGGLRGVQVAPPGNLTVQ